MSDMRNETNTDEEIDFRPLSEGLGFKDKIIPQAASPKKSSPASDSSNLKYRSHLYQEHRLNSENFSGDPQNAPLDSSILEPKKSLSGQSSFYENSSEEVFNPLPLGAPKNKRQESWAGDIDLGGSPPVDGIVEDGGGTTVIDNPFFTPSKPISPVEVVTLKFSGHDGLKKKPVRPGLFSLTAIFIDFLTLISLTMIGSTFYLGNIKYSLSEFLLQLPYNPAFKAQVIGATLSLGFLYLVLSRCFFGRTIGEWMFRLQLGSEEDQGKATYPVRVLIRSFFILISGFFIFPVLSLIFRKDLLFYLSGLSLHGEAHS